MRFTRYLLIVSILTSLLACQDHRLSLLTQQNVRIKRITASSGGPVVTSNIDEFTYDNVSQLVSKRSFSPTNSSTFTRTSYTYDTQKRLTRIEVTGFTTDPNVGLQNTRTEIAYSTDGKSASLTYFVSQDNSNVFRQVAQYTEQFDDTGKLIRLVSSTLEYAYTYANGNVTSVLQTFYSSSGSVTAQFRYLYEYDDRPNAHFGLPDVYFTNQFATNKNNVLRSTTQSFNRLTNQFEGGTVPNILSYNAQNLPTSLIMGGQNNTGQPAREDYEYEPY